MSEDWYYNQYNSDDSLLLESPNLEEAIGTINNTNISINENVTKQYSEEQEKPSSEETFANSFRQKVGQINYNDSFNQSSNLDPNNNDGVASFSLTNNTYNYYKKLVEISRCLGKTTLSKPELDTRSNMVDLLGFLAEQKSRTTNDLNFDNYFANPQKGSTNLKRRTSYLFKEICLDKRSFSIAVLLDETNRAWADILWTLREEYLSDTKKNFNDYVEWNIESIDKISLITFTVNGLIIEKLNSPQIRCRAAFIKKNPKSLKSVEKLCFQLSAPAIQPSFDSTQQILPNTNYSSFAIPSYTSENPMNEELYEKGIDNVIPTGYFIQNEPEEENMHYNHYTTQSDSNSEIDIEMQLYTSMINPSSSLSDTIQQDKTSTQQYNVPKLPQIHDLLPRKNYTDKLRELLLTSSNENSNIVVLNGPRGCGLTTLASIVCHGYHYNDSEKCSEDYHDLDGRFRDGIYYFSFRTDDANRTLSAKLFESIENKAQSGNITDNRALLALVEKKALLILDDLDSEEALNNIIDVLQSKNTCKQHLTLLVITSAFRSFQNAKVCTINFLDKEEAKMLLFNRAKLDKQKLTNISLQHAEKILVYCDGYTLAISFIAEYLSKIEREDKKMEMLRTVVGWIEEGDLEVFKSYHNGRTTTLEEYLTSDYRKEQRSVELTQLALFPGGCAIPFQAFNLLWSMSGKTLHNVNFLWERFILFKEQEQEEGEELYSLPFLCYLLMRKQCDQTWFSNQTDRNSKVLREYSFESYLWIKKNAGRMGVIFEKHLKFLMEWVSPRLENLHSSNELQKLLIEHVHFVKYYEAETVQDVERQFDRTLEDIKENLIERHLKKIEKLLFRLGIQIDDKLPENIDSFFQTVIDSINVKKWFWTQTFEKHYNSLQQITNLLTVYKFFKGLQSKWKSLSFETQHLIAQRNDNSITLIVESIEDSMDIDYSNFVNTHQLGDTWNDNSDKPSGNYTREPQSSVEEVTSQITLVNTSGELIRQNNNNLSEDRFVTSNEELTTQYALSDHFFASHEHSNDEKYLDVEDVDHN